MNSAEKQTVLHCLKSMVDEAACEECPLYGMTGTDHCEKDCVRLAINTLEQEPCTDAINRQAVLEILNNAYFLKLDDGAALQESVNQLPPVKPQYTDAEIQKMQDLEFAEIQKAYELGKAEMQPCEDAISRQAVLDMMQMRMGAKELYRAVYDLPPVNPAEKVGRWVFVKGYEGILYECTVCKNKNTHTTVRWNYCPHCGAKMREVEE